MAPMEARVGGPAHLPPHIAAKLGGESKEEIR